MAALPGGGVEHKSRSADSSSSSIVPSSRYEGFGSDDLEIAEQIAFADAATKRSKTSHTSSSISSSSPIDAAASSTAAAVVPTPSLPINTRIPIVWTCDYLANTNTTISVSAALPASGAVTKTKDSRPPEVVDVIVCDDSGTARLLTGVPFSSIVPGNIVIVRKMQYSPADLLVIASSEPNDECYIHTACFDGSKSMLMRQAIPLPVTLSLRDIKDIPDILIPTLVTQIRASNPSIWQLMAAIPSKKTDDINIGIGRSSDATIIRVADYKYFIPHQAQIFMCDWVAGIAVYTNAHTKFSLNDSWDGAKKKEEDKKNEEREKKQKLEAERRAKEALKPNAVQRALLFEQSSMINWENRWTDVDDDGNCMLTAFWMGLTALIKHYPSVRRDDDSSLPTNAEAFRQDLFDRLRSDHLYRQSMRNQFDVYFTMDEGFLIGMEDFYTLPDHIRERILVAKRQMAGGNASAGGMPTSEWQCDACTSYNMAGEQLCTICGTPYTSATTTTTSATSASAKPGGAADLDSYVSSYIDAVTTPTLINGRRVYVPLGQAEISALSRLYHVKLQTMSSDGILKSMTAVTLEEIDPRSIESRDIQDWIPESQHASSSSSSSSTSSTNGNGVAPASRARVVRLLNVKRNHYYVHLPRAAVTVTNEQAMVQASATHNAALYWRRPLDTLELPPL